MRKLLWGLVLAAGAAAAQPSAPPPAPIDYAQPASWLCRPGRADACSTGLDALAIDGAGRRTPRPFRPDPAAKVDCFYVYPTISRDPGTYSDLAPGDAEEREVARAQAGLLNEKCRVFVPLYRQLTLTALGRIMRQPGAAGSLQEYFAVPYGDVLAAWRSYLAHDNRGRGVILIGHSQGAMLLRRLLGEEVDGKPVRERLVAAYLAGNTNLVATTFRTIAPCRGGGDTGCVVAWSSYLEGDAPARRVFGGAGASGAAVCVDPAAPGGGRGALKLFLPKPPEAPAADPPFVEAVGQLSANCVGDAAGAVLRVRIEPSVEAPRLRAAFGASSPYALAPGWGLHRFDLSLVQGNLLDLIAAQSAAWGRR